jgi:hypothetical protein
VDEGLITACAFDGQRMKPRAEWNDRKAFFTNTTDHGFIRVRITTAGVEHIERLLAAGRVWGNRTCVAKRQSPRVGEESRLLSNEESSRSEG